MPATVAYQGRGSHLQTSPDGVTYSNVAQLQKFSFSGLKATLEDITNIDSPSAFKEFLPTIVDPGDVSFDGILDPQNTTIEGLTTLLQNFTKTFFKIILSEGTFMTFTGYVVEYVPASVDYAKAITFSGKIQITGPVTTTIV